MSILFPTSRAGEAAIGYPQAVATYVAALVPMLWLPLAPAAPAAVSGCAGCHAGVARVQAGSSHARTLERYEGSQLSRLLPPSIELGGFWYEHGPSRVTVRRNTERAIASLEWAFGAGGHGMTAVGRYDGIHYEYRLSYYAGPGTAALTPGHPAAPPRTAADALGVLKLPQDIYRCFNCHATGVEADADGGPDLSRAAPGITCERCHGPGEKHAAAARAGQPSTAIAKEIFNAGRLPAKAQVQFCGGCHRLPEPGRPSGTPEVDHPLSVRFQPIGLMASRCFRESGRLTCLTCHDPHQDVRRDPAFYTAKCLGCHADRASAAATCRRREREDCVTCHMRRATPLPHLTFTDHRIRVVPD
jgi:hypothetical protein